MIWTKSNQIDFLATNVYILLNCRPFMRVWFFDKFVDLGSAHKLIVVKAHFETFVHWKFRNDFRWCLIQIYVLHYYIWKYWKKNSGQYTWTFSILTAKNSLIDQFFQKNILNKLSRQLTVSAAILNFDESHQLQSSNLFKHVNLSFHTRS